MVDTRKELVKQLESAFKQIKDKRIKTIELYNGWFSGEDYTTDLGLVVEFESKQYLKIQSPCVGIASVELLTEKPKYALPQRYTEIYGDEEMSDENLTFSNFNGEEWTGFEVEGFSHRYSLNSIDMYVRLEGGDYFSYIFLNIGKDKKIVIIGDDVTKESTNVRFIERQETEDETKQWKRDILEEQQYMQILPIEIDTKKDLEQFLDQVCFQLKDIKVNSIEIESPYFDKDNDCYTTDGNLLIKFDNEMMIGISNLIASQGEYYLTDYLDIDDPHYDFIYSKFNGCRLVGYKIEGFSHEYEINASTGETRPDGGDYYSKVYLYFENNKTICFEAQDSVSDGYMDIHFIEK